eukprot:CAMPEP_0176506280 /NCGR_PEP_ID=MMETSP0200_2-20121128/16947_1 /TAXON_ID=947934 /ORGANISM="Chaetoceros sp., Strain GSL56" /LENGTH=79 /DNA_ID=CAMNT_0017905897 /DNA_START=1290 /DNA_END=1529 /DNA_ORIENTATION=-
MAIGLSNREEGITAQSFLAQIQVILQRSTDSQGTYDVFVDMIHQMLSYRPRERITATEALEHPFIVAGEHSQAKAMSAA